MRALGRSDGLRQRPVCASAVLFAAPSRALSDPEVATNATPSFNWETNAITYACVTGTAAMRRVIKEDKAALEEAGYGFNLFSIMGGQLAHDAEHKLYLIYPQGNWVEVTESTPYYVIGESRLLANPS